MKMKHLSALLMLALPVAACATAGAPAPVALNPADTNFVTTSYQIIQLDDQEGELAAMQAADPRVKAIAGDLIAKADLISPKLNLVVGTDGIDLPTRLSDAEQASVDALTPLSGKAFDRAYLNDQIASHERGVAVIRAEQASTKDPQMLALANQTLPIVQDDLTRLQAIAATL